MPGSGRRFDGMNPTVRARHTTQQQPARRGSAGTTTASVRALEGLRHVPSLGWPRQPELERDPTGLTLVLGGGRRAGLRERRSEDMVELTMR